LAVIVKNVNKLYLVEGENMIDLELKDELTGDFRKYEAPGYEDTGKPPKGYEVIVLENAREPLERLAELVRANADNMRIEIDLEREAIVLPALGILFVVQQLNPSGVDYPSTRSNLFAMKEKIGE
jgi:hypothetical protein